MMEIMLMLFVASFIPTILTLIRVPVNPMKIARNADYFTWSSLTALKESLYWRLILGSFCSLKIVGQLC